MASVEIRLPESASIRTDIVIGMSQDFKESIHGAAGQPTAGSIYCFFTHPQPARVVVAWVTEHGQEFGKQGVFNLLRWRFIKPRR